MNPINSLLGGDQLWAKVARFALVGGISTVAYGIFTMVSIQQLALSPMIATIMGYLIAIPLNYLLQRLFTFRSKTAMKRELPRFLVVHSLNMAGSFAIMLVIVKAMHADYRWGIATTMVVVPILVFLAMDTWVFRRFPH